MSENTIRSTEKLVSEPLAARLGLDRPSSTAIQHQCNSASFSSTPEADGIVEALKAISTARSASAFQWQGREHQIVVSNPANPAKGTGLTNWPGSEIAVQVVVAPIDNPAQHIYVKYAIFQNRNPATGEPKAYLACEGNPTTLLAGNNVLPFSKRDSTSELVERFPSSAPATVTHALRVMFPFLEKLAGHVQGDDVHLFHDGTQEALRHGDFAITHIQWAAYLHADAPRFLRMLVAMFAPPVATSDGIMTVAKQLGLRFNYETDDRSDRVKAIIMEKRRGKNPNWSFVAYDKRKSLSHMRQGKSLTPAEGELVDNHVRLDLTAHQPAIIEIIGAARSWIKKNALVADKIGKLRQASEFLSGEPKPTARWLEFAIYTLSHRVIRKKVVRGSFASFLLPHVINQVFRFDAVSNFTIADLYAFEHLDDTIAKAWRSIDNFKGTNWVKALSKASGYHKSVLYERCKEWRKIYRIDISLPRGFYRDFCIYGPSTLQPKASRDAWLEARKQSDSAQLLQLLGDADDRFFAELETVVSAAFKSGPVALPFKVLGEIALAPPDDSAVLALGELDAANQVPVDRDGANIPYVPPRRWHPVNDLPGNVSAQSSLAKLTGARDQIQRELKNDDLHFQTRRKKQRQLTKVKRLIFQKGETVRKSEATRKRNKARQRFKRANGHWPKEDDKI